MTEYYKGLNRAAEKYDSLTPEDVFPDEEDTEANEAEREHRKDEARENARERAWEEY